MPTLKVTFSQLVAPTGFSTHTSECPQKLPPLRSETSLFPKEYLPMSSKTLAHEASAAASCHGQQKQASPLTFDASSEATPNQETIWSRATQEMSLQNLSGNLEQYSKQ